MANITQSETVNHRIDEVLALSLDRLSKVTVVSGLVTNYSEQAKNQGVGYKKVVSVPKRGSFTVKNKTPNTPATTEAVSDDKESLTIDKHKYVFFSAEDSALVFLNNPVSYLTDTMQDVVDSIAETIEADVISAMVQNASRIIGQPNAGASPNLITLTNKYSRQDHWYANKDKFFVWGSQAEEDLLNTDLFRAVNQAGTDDMQVNGKIGKKLGWNHYVSDMMPTIVGSPSAEHNLAFQSAGVGLAFASLDLNELPEFLRPQNVIQRSMVINDTNGKPVFGLRITIDYSVENLAPRVMVDTMYGVAVMEDKLVYDVLV